MSWVVRASAIEIDQQRELRRTTLIAKVSRSTHEKTKHSRSIPLSWQYDQSWLHSDLIYDPILFLSKLSRKPCESRQLKRSNQKSSRFVVFASKGRSRSCLDEDVGSSKKTSNTSVVIGPDSQFSALSKRLIGMSHEVSQFRGWNTNNSNTAESRMQLGEKIFRSRLC